MAEVMSALSAGQLQRLSSVQPAPEATRKALEVVASGAGSGHGVGLCQTGARAMARGGLSAERILSHYYPGTELKRLY